MMADEGFRKQVAAALSEHVPMALFRRRSINAIAAKMADSLEQAAAAGDGGGTSEDAAAVDEARVRAEAVGEVLAVLDELDNRTSKKKAVMVIREHFDV